MDRDDVGKPVDGELRRMLLSPGQLEEDVRRELRFHIEGRIAELRSRGWSEEDAQAEALRSFGDLERIARECLEIGMERIHRERRSQKMRDALTDLRYALRTFRRNPVFAGIVVFTLALGIGATTAVFTVVDRVAIRALPFLDPDRLVVLWEQNLSQGIPADNPSPPNLYDWRDRTRSFAGIAAWDERAATLTGVERAEVLSIARTTANFFSVLGVHPEQGRTFTTEEELVFGAEDDQPIGSSSAILSFGAWQRVFGGGDLLGRSIILDGVPFEVVGIMPEGFTAPRPEVDLWVPALLADPDAHRQTRMLNVVGRLADGVSIEQAGADLDGVATRLATEYPDANTGWGVTLIPARDQIVGETGQVLLMILASVGFVLLIACANVANLLLGRAATRTHEFGVRTAIGASAARLRRQLLTESLTLGALGGVGGVVLAYVGIRTFLRLEPTIPRIEEVGMDLRVLAFAAALSVGTAILFGYVPASRAGRGYAGAALKEGGPPGRSGRRRGRARPMLVVSEVALSLVLLVGAGLFLRSFLALRSVDPGFEREGVLAAKVALNATAYPDNAARAQYFDLLLDEIRSIPGVTYAGITSTLPMDPAGTDFDLARHAEGHPMVPEGEATQTDYRIISPGYLEAMDISVTRGRDFEDTDRADTPPVLLVTETLAESLWPGESPIGKQITIYYVRDRAWEVVGVVADTHHRGLSVPPRHQMFVPMAQAEFLFGYMTLVVKERAAAAPTVNAIRDAATSVDPTHPLFDIQTVEQLVGQSVARDRLATASFGIFAVLALLLASAGIYGVTSYQVSSRRREIGVRMALGAQRGSVVRQVVREAVSTAGVGVVVGLVASVFLTRLASSFLFGISALDPAVFLGVPVLLVGIAALSALPPARRAASIDPVQAIRSD